MLDFRSKCMHAYWDFVVHSFLSVIKFLREIERKHVQMAGILGHFLKGSYETTLRLYPLPNLPSCFAGAL